MVSITGDRARTFTNQGLGRSRTARRRQMATRVMDDAWPYPPSQSSATAGRETAGVPRLQIGITRDGRCVAVNPPADRIRTASDLPYGLQSNKRPLRRLRTWVRFSTRLPRTLSASPTIHELIPLLIQASELGIRLEIGPPFYLSQGVKDVIVFDPLTLLVLHVRKNRTTRQISPVEIDLECGCRVLV